MADVRAATTADEASVEALLRRCLPDAGPAEATAVAVQDGVVVGVVCAETPLSGHLVVTVLAVHPDARRRGVASSLVGFLLAERAHHHRLASLTTTSEDHAVLRLAFRHGFVVFAAEPRRGGDPVLRLHLQRHARRRFHLRSGEGLLVRADSTDHLSALLGSGDWVLTGLTSGVPRFEVCRIDRDDMATLRSDENSGSVTFAGNMLAAITFILGILFASPQFPNDVRILLITAAFSTLLSLVIYANATGDLARLRADEFADHARVGNVLSEYGGVLPFLISLPVAFAQVAHSFPAALITGAASSAALLGYMRSRFSIASRYPTSVTTAVLQALICADPLLGVVITQYFEIAWPWTASTVAMLAALALIHLRGHSEEASPVRR
ncbi:GNAT family N-acetyltransferase [Actinosynnema sp. NPDC020468]|uniref:GNAT family N-acetyltransferase n=1 Tax=Actinosynnema sp. NPDC020468 TaxID=3154488 RepID=UPI0033E6A4F2